MLYLRDVPDFNSFETTYEDIFYYDKPFVFADSISKFPRFVWFFFKALNRVMFDKTSDLAHALPEEPGDGKSILDIGCSDGQKLMRYYKNGYEVFGLDVNEAALKKAHEAMPKANFKQGVLSKDTYPASSFDFIRVDNTLEHVYEPVKFLKFVKRILKPSGTLYIYVPNGNSLLFKVFGKYSSHSWVPFHVNQFSPNTIRRGLEVSGFRRIKIRTLPSPHAVILSIRQLRGNINIRYGVTNHNNTLKSYLFELLISPITNLIGRLGFGEEIFVVAQK